VKNNMQPTTDDGVKRRKRSGTPNTPEREAALRIRRAEAGLAMLRMYVPADQLPALKQRLLNLVSKTAIDERTFQSRVNPWMYACFGGDVAADKEKSNHRFLEEALELVQACGCSNSEAHQLVDYVFKRPIGDRKQEVGGVMVTLAALCLAQALDMHESGETELARIWKNMEQIRARQDAKPAHSPLPAVIDSEQPAGLAYAEVKRLTLCLQKANEQSERFERQWYLRGDMLEDVLEAVRERGSENGEATIQTTPFALPKELRQRIEHDIAPNEALNDLRRGEQA